MNYKLYKNYFIFANHGHAKQEMELGQKFVIDIHLFGKDLEKIDSVISDDQIQIII